MNPPADAAPQGRPARPLRLAAGDFDLARLPAAGLEQIAGTAGQRLVARFDAPLTPTQRDDLAAAGVRVLEYLSDGAYVVRVDRQGSAVRAGRVPHAAWAGRFDAAWKLEPGIGKRDFVTPARQAMSRVGDAAVVITLFPDADPAEISDVAGAIGAVRGATLHQRSQIAGSQTITATLPLSALPALAAMPAVQFIEDAPELTERNITTRWIVQSDIPNVTPLYNAGLTGFGQVLGLIDNKPDVNHCSFLDSNPIGPAHRKILAFNTTTDSPVTHGTHVAGIAVGSNSDSSDFSDTRGVAYDARFVYSPIPTFTESTILATLNLHHSQGARVHTNSWGNDSTTSYDSMCRGIDSFMYSNEDDLVAFAVTNSSTLKNPENCKNAIAVGACQDAGGENNFCSGGVGPTADGRRKPEIFAPGCSIVSSASGTTCGTVPLTGTSMACPAVAGTALLVREYFTNGYYPSGAPSVSAAFTPSGALVKAVLLNGATDMTGIAGYPSNQEGWGRVLAHNTLHFPGDTRNLFVRDVRNVAGLSTGAVINQSITVNAAGLPLRATLVWTDPPAAAGAANPMINDLDLEVASPSGPVYLGNVFASGVSATGGTRDSLNNVEQVLIPAPAAGVWTVRVKGAAVNQGLQGYALVVSGDIVTPPQAMQVFVNAPAPTIIAPDTLTTFPVTISPGGESLVGGTALLHYRANNSQAYSTSILVPQGSGQYLATLPRLGCDDQPQFYVSANGSLSGEIRSPVGAPSTVFGVTVGAQSDTTLLNENFEGGSLPAGWNATGLWHVTDACPQLPACDGTRWAYFGQDSTCTYDTGARAFGVLTSAPVDLPLLPGGGKVTLTYCSALGRENSSTYDLATVLVNGIQVETVTAASTAWNTHTVDLSSFAGQTVNIAWSFDSIDGFLNGFLGWQVDHVQVVASTIGCSGPHHACPTDLTADHITGTPDLAILLSHFGQSVAPFTLGDFNGDGQVNTFDLAMLLGSFGVNCPG